MFRRQTTFVLFKIRQTNARQMSHIMMSNQLKREFLISFYCMDFQFSFAFLYQSKLIIDLHIFNVSLIEICRKKLKKVLYEALNARSLTTFFYACKMTWNSSASLKMKLKRCDLPSGKMDLVSPFFHIYFLKVIYVPFDEYPEVLNQIDS